MAKRKRELEPVTAQTKANGHDGAHATAHKIAKTNDQADVKTTSPVIQIVAGSYERVLHGITASISETHTATPIVEFADSFLFNAHASAIRCLALSPLPELNASDAQGVYLATGGSDERVNVYSLSPSPLSNMSKLPAMPTLGSNKVSENPGNRELGSLMQHSSNITALHFPTRSKLLSASEDNTINISRVRDLTVISTVKAPRPKVQGQPSGDTAPPGASPAGVNDFAIHPSMKLMISVGKGERTMRLWNLVTGKKAGVLNFDRHILQAVKEAKYSSGEGRRIRWNPEGTEFAVSFERGVAIFGDDSKPRNVALPQPLTKVHQIAYHQLANQVYLTVSTEDGRILFYDTSIVSPKNGDGVSMARLVAQLGGKAVQINGRVKDFKILCNQAGGESASKLVFLVTANSDGTIRLWTLKWSDLQASSAEDKSKQIGVLVGTYETGNRITCLDAFIMHPAREEDMGLSEFEGATEAEESSSGSEDSD